IDAAGNVTLPGFAMAFATDFCLPRSPDYPLVPDLTTGLQFRFVTGQVFPLEGVALDFTTGTLTLNGQDVIPAACGAPGPLLSGPAAPRPAGAIPRPAEPPAPADAGEARRQGEDRQAAAEHPAQEARQGRRPDAHDPPCRLAVRARSGKPRRLCQDRQRRR